MNMPQTAVNRRTGNTPPSTGGSWAGTGAPIPIALEPELLHEGFTYSRCPKCILTWWILARETAALMALTIALTRNAKAP